MERFDIEPLNKLAGEMADKYGLPDSVVAPSISHAAMFWSQNFSNLLRTFADANQWQVELSVNGRLVIAEISMGAAEIFVVPNTPLN